MKETVSRIIEKESPNGLIVTKALYGKVRLEDKSEYVIQFLLRQIYEFD